MFGSRLDFPATGRRFNRQERNQATPVLLRGARSPRGAFESPFHLRLACLVAHRHLARHALHRAGHGNHGHGPAPGRFCPGSGGGPLRPTSADLSQAGRKAQPQQHGFTTTAALSPRQRGQRLSDAKGIARANQKGNRREIRTSSAGMSPCSVGLLVEPAPRTVRRRRRSP